MKKTGWIIAGIVVALLLLLGGIWWGYTGTYSYRPWGMMGGPNMMWGFGSHMGPWGGFGTLLFWVLVIAGIVWLAQVVSRSQHQAETPRSASDAPLDILKRRYAAGEITKDQFDEMQRSLTS